MSRGDVTPSGYTFGGAHMPVLPAWPLFATDSRANRLDDYWLAVNNTTGQHYVYLRGSGQMARQVTLAYGETGCRIGPVPADKVQEFTHRVAVPRAATAADRDMLELMKEILTLECSAPVDAALALDWHTIPDPEVDSMHWDKTETGHLVRRAKYGENNEFGRELAARMVRVIERHPVYASADVIVTVPSHDIGGRRFSERLANTVAKGIGKPIVWTEAAHTQRAAAKDVEGPRVDLSSEFTVPAGVAGKQVIVIDDLYMTGRTMRAVARAAKASGAALVLGFTATRTLRR
jgi:predicted amidophosphoribosyltransferase